MLISLLCYFVKANPLLSVYLAGLTMVSVAIGMQDIAGGFGAFGGGLMLVAGAVAMGRAMRV